MEQRLCLAICLVVFVIYGSYSDGIPKNVPINPLHKPEGKNADNQYPDIVNEKTVVSNNTNRQSEFGKYLNNNRDSRLRKDRHSSGAHSVTKRGDGARVPPIRITKSERRVELERRVTEAAHAVQTQIDRRAETQRLLEEQLDSEQMIRQIEDALLTQYEDEILNAGGSEEMAFVRRSERQRMWELLADAQDRWYDLTMNEINERLQVLEDRLRVAQDALRDFNDGVNRLFGHDGEL